MWRHFAAICALGLRIGADGAELSSNTACVVARGRSHAHMEVPVGPMVPPQMAFLRRWPWRTRSNGPALSVAEELLVRRERRRIKDLDAGIDAVVDQCTALVDED